MKRLPKLPSELSSALGPIKVTFLDMKVASEQQVFGLFHPDSRTIEIAPGMSRAMEWATLWHEATHAALMDAGTNNVITSVQAESVCDAMGTFLTAMMQAGFLTVTKPR